MAMRVFQTWVLSLTAALYLFRGMLEFPVTGWQPQVLLTVVIGVGVLPVLAAVASSTTTRRGRAVIAGFSLLGMIVNAVLLVLLWDGFTPVSLITLAIILAYAAAAMGSWHRVPDGT